MLLALALVAIAGVSVPSFPCAEARTPHERLICGDAPLATADAILAASYRRARAALGREARAELARSQAAWLRFSRTVCPHDRQSTWGAPAECLRRAYAVRLYEMDPAVRRLGPLTVLRLDSYALWPAPPEDPDGEHPGFFTASVRRDWIDPAPLSGALRRAALRWNARAALPARWVLHSRPRRNPDPSAFEETDFADTSHEIEILAASIDVISSEEREHTYSHGSAHGYGSSRYALVSTRNGRHIGPATFFSPGTDWREHVGRGSRAFVGRTWYEETLRDRSSWRITQAGVAINFGEVFGYASGDQIVEMSWSELDPFLSPFGRRIARGLSR